MATSLFLSTIGESFRTSATDNELLPAVTCAQLQSHALCATVACAQLQLHMVTIALDQHQQVPTLGITH